MDRLAALGAQVVLPATQVGEVTVFARLKDPRGNTSSLFSRATSKDFQERAEATEEHMQQTSFQPQPGSMAWFEIGTTDFEATTGFYRAAFGWRFEKDTTAGGIPQYSIFTGGDWPAGGLFDHGGRAGGADYAIPCILVADVAATATAAVAAGASLEQGPESTPHGHVFARLTDPHSNRFGLFSMPAYHQGA